MKKTKLLKPILTFASIGAIAAAIPSIASCSCNGNAHIEAGAIEGNIIGNNMATYLTYSLRDKLADGQTITIEHGDTGLFTFVQPTVAGKVVTVPVYWLKTTENEASEWTGDITFNCMNGDKKVWSEVVKGTKVTYLPYCMLESEKSICIEDPTVETTIAAEFTFSIPTGLPDEETYHPNLKVVINEIGYDDNDLKVDVDAVNISEFDDTSKTFTVTVPASTKGQTSIGEGYEINFDIQVYCMYGDTNIPIWISNNFKALNMFYSAKALAIPEEFLDLEETEYPGYGPCTILKGINNANALPEGVNTLLLPVDCYMIGNGGDPIHDLPNSIHKIVAPLNSYLTFIKPNALANYNQITCLDFSNIPDTTSGLETMQFDENAFYGWADKGKVIWGTNFSQYKRHLVMMKLYNAGLDKDAWFNIVNVDSESKLREACSVGNNIRLTNDITIAAQKDEEGKPTYTGQIDIKEDLVINLNGHTVTSEGPIYNWDMAEFAIFGIWKDSQVILTDTSGNHNGAVIAYNNSGLKTTTTPTTPGPEGENELWDWRIDENKWQPRECRCFYIRTDTPTRAQPSLWMLAGRLEGCCTTIMNWNGACWIQEDFKADGDTTHKWAPSFKLLTPYSNYSNTPSTEYCRELLNCDDQKHSTGDAYFEIYGGKFYGYKDGTNPYDFYDAANARADKKPDGTYGANWLANEEMRDLFEVDKTHASDPEPYYVVHKKA